MDDIWQQVWQHRARLLAIASYRCPTREDAEDVVSEAMLRCATFERVEPQRLGQLLTSVTVRLCVDLARSRAAAARAAARCVDPPVHPVEVVLDAYEARWLAQAVALTRSEAAALDARAAGLTTEEAALALGVGVRAMESALTRARRKMLSAWRTTLAILAGLLAPRRTGPVFAATAVVAVFAGCPPTRVAEAPAAPRTVAAKPSAVSARDEPQPKERGASRARMPGAQPAATPRPSRTERADSDDADPSVATPSLSAGPVASDSSEVVVDDDERVDSRVARCVERGVVIDVNRVHVTCRE